MTTRRWLLRSLGILFAAWPFAGAVVATASPGTGDADLRETLTFRLRPRLPEEKEFIEQVVLKVKAGILPLEMVVSTYRWAEGRKPYPFPFFKRALRMRAAQIGVHL